jgi:hypothetical protein
VLLPAAAAGWPNRCCCCNLLVWFQLELLAPALLLLPLGWLAAGVGGGKGQ